MIGFQVYCFQDLFPDLVYNDILFFSSNINDVGMISVIEGLTAAAMSAGLLFSFALQCFGKGIGDQPFPSPCTAQKKIGVRNLPTGRRCFQLVCQGFIPSDFFKCIQIRPLLSVSVYFLVILKGKSKFFAMRKTANLRHHSSTHEAFASRSLIISDGSPADEV